MADKKNRYKQNVPGLFYVDTECINCDACLLAAENHFKINEDEAYAYVYKQPQNEEEKAACQEALEACPVEAIGKDGDNINIGDNKEDTCDNTNTGDNGK